MKMRNVFHMEKAENKYDAAIRAFYLVFYAAAFIIFFAVGLSSMKLQTWVMAFFCSAFGATVYGTIAKLIIMMIRKDKPINKAHVLTKLLRVIFFSLATVAFVAAGMQENDIKTWLIAFVCSYGTAAIYSFVVKLIVTLAKKDQ